MIDAPEVRLELGAEVGLVAGLDRRDVRVAGVVDHDVEAAEAFHAGVDRGLDGVGVGHVERERKYPVAVPFGEPGELLGPAAPWPRRDRPPPGPLGRERARGRAMSR